MTAVIDDGADFLAKWRRRWPEWRIGMAFVAPSEQARVEAWFALLDEFADAAWGGADPTPGLAKLAWWQEELQGWAKGARRHPLATTLQRLDAPWQTLALALRVLPATRESGQASDTALQLRDLARAIAACESRLFGVPAAAGDADAGLVAPLLAARACLHGDRDQAVALLAAWPANTAGPRPRRIANAMLAGRLRSLARSGQARPARGPAALWASWRAARAR